MTMTALEILVAAKAAIEKGWVQEAYAADGKNALYAPRAAEATCFCSLGAIAKVVEGLSIVEISECTDGPVGVAKAELAKAMKKHPAYAQYAPHGGMDTTTKTILNYNDDSRSTQKVISECFAEAAKSARCEELKCEIGKEQRHVD